jgi:hypothetical protein
MVGGAGGGGGAALVVAGGGGVRAVQPESPITVNNKASFGRPPNPFATRYSIVPDFKFLVITNPRFSPPLSNY